MTIFSRLSLLVVLFKEYNVDNTLKHLSLCTGYGGIDLGLSRVLPDVRTVAYVEIEAFAVHNLVAKIEKGWLDAAPIWTNLKTFGWSSFRGKVDILSGGFPCQPFSAAGRRGGDEDPRHLWPHIVRGIRELGRPPIVFFENVEGILSSKLKSDEWSDPEGTPVLLHVLRELERLGYKATAGVFSAEEVGAPHRRKRVFIMGVCGSSTEQAFVPNTAYPAGRGADQHAWEPPRITELVNTLRGDKGSSGRESGVLLEETEDRETTGSERTNINTGAELQREAEPSLGGDADGSTCRMDLAKLYGACDNRTDELRMLGNGVVPDCASKAFVTLLAALEHSSS
jgi:DNA (cytosine-5)-methyltransferase 1